ncbi:MAG TPA: NAD(P)/FAD-dependent oxidoreductase [Acidimicrobiales bacterium]|nr:NAD(P)/FAD-dependent oxidoreductase [Acidimicrobiales bacterium]
MGAGPGDAAGPSGPEEPVDVVVVGAGFSGVGMAVRLRQIGVVDFVVLDRGPDAGGTWRDNTYPGAACDVPSHLYSFSFAPNPGWSRAYSPQAEIHRYLQGCVDRFGVGGHFRFGQDVVEAAYDEAAQRWWVRTATGTVLSARVLVWATGPLSEPLVPDLPGLDGFTGRLFHTAAWDHDYDLAGKRVAVVGTGASAVQLVPEIQPEVAELVVYQRSAPWVVPRNDRPIGRRRRRLYRAFPPARLAARAWAYLRLELLMGPIVRGRNDGRQALVERMAAGYRRRQVPDPVLRAKLEPDYRLGCKRVLISDDYYPALTRPNVDVVPAAVREVRGDTVVDEAGGRRQVDAVVLATGFRAAEPTFATRIRGAGGRRLSEAWAGGMAAYLGCTVAGFPNLFMLIGPNTTLGHNSMVYMIESHLNYVAGAVAFLGRPGVGTVDVRPDVMDRFSDRVQRDMAGTAWVTGGCTSWYLDRRGRNTTLWPGTTYRFRRQTRRFHPADYVVRPPVPAGGGRRGR